MTDFSNPEPNGRRPRGVEVSVASQRRRQIMQAVMDCITDYGLEHTTMRTVAQRAGVSTGTLAYYFQSKKDLVDAALLDASRKYMERFNVEKGGRAPSSLGRMVDRFLSTDNSDAGFVLQMIEVGLHNAELRGTHLEMIEAGRVMIEHSIRAGIEAGVYRDDIDPKLTAALLHGVMIWWGSELIWNATSEELAREVSRLALHLLEPPHGAAPRAGATANTATPDAIHALLVKDPRLDPDDAQALSEAIAKLYGVAARLPAERDGPRDAVSSAIP
jgi:AcrR family transcriptional regulator